MVQTVGYLYGVEFPAVGDVRDATDYGIEGDSLTGTLEVEGGTPPGVPTFTVATGVNAVTVTIDSDASVTNYVRYKGSSDTTWQDGGSRSGDGDVTVSSLDNDVPYIIEVYSVDAAGLSSTPGVAVITTLSATSINDADDELDDLAVEMLAAFGESVTYWPAGGGSRAITAVIDRNPPRELDGLPHGHTKEWIVLVANSSTTGISSSEIDCGGDKIEIPARMGEVAQKRRIVNILSQDSGAIRMEVR